MQKNLRSIKWTTEHTLTPDQLHQLIREKLERAEQQRGSDTAQLEKVKESEQNA